MKTALITGAGRGLGRAIANAYHQAGFLVIVSDIDIDLLTDLKEQENTILFQMDVAKEEEVELAAAKINKLFGKVDVLVSNAGIFDFYPVSESGAEKLKKIFDVNVFGLANLTKFFLPLLSVKKGRLIVISSESYKVPSPFQPYSVSKQALESLYKSIKIELSLKGVKSILIRPGAMNTKILDDTIHFKKAEKESRLDDEFTGFLETVPKYIGKVANPEEVAKIVLKAGTKKYPKPSYSFNHNPLVSLLSIMPEHLKNLLINKSLRIKN